MEEGPTALLSTVKFGKNLKVHEGGERQWARVIPAPAGPRRARERLP